MPFSKIAQIYGLEQAEVPDPQGIGTPPAAPESPGIFENLGNMISSLIPWAFLAALWAIWKIVAIILSIILLIGIVYSRIRLGQVVKEQDERLGKQVEEARTAVARPVNDKWGQVENHLASQNENDWRLAIMEADIMLDEMMSAMGYTQDTLGEKLQSVEKSDFNTINQAWEAHKVRNKIAHEGSNFILTQREAQRTLALYREVFEEFNYI